MLNLDIDDQLPQLRHGQINKNHNKRNIQRLVNGTFYPNPTTDEITYESRSKILPSTQMKIFNSYNQIIKSFILPDGLRKYKFSLKEFPPGVYFAIIMNNTQPIQSSKLIKLK